MANSISKIHADWVSLLDISGPFVSMPILVEVFPQGVEDVTPELVRSLKADFEFWQERSDDVAVHSAWVRLVLESLLGYAGDGVGATRESPLLSGQAIPAGLKAEFPEHEEILRPDFVLMEPLTPSPSPAGRGERVHKLLIQVFPPTQDLGKAVSGSRWAASAGTRMMELLHATETRLGLLTNGEQWMLVDAPRGGTTGFATWYASLWFEERATLNSFFSLLGARRFFGVDENETLEALMKRSEDHQQEITDQLGLQVRHAVEILIQAVDKAEQDARGSSTALRSAQNEPNLLYEAALTVMMRLVFLLSAEERKLLPIEDEQYANYYAVSTLREQLQKLAADHGEEVLERRFDAWSRLLAVFRAVHGGIRHQDLILPAYGGSLFDPERYPFLEGRALTTETTESTEKKKLKTSVDSVRSVVKNEVPLAIDNRTVLHLLDALQLLRVDGEMRRLSFRALDVEQIGHVYEGLLDHKAVRADEVMLGLGGAKRLEPEVRLAALEQERAKGEASFAAWLKDVTQRSAAALKRSLEVDPQKNAQKDALKLGRLRSACGNDDALLGRVLPFAGLIRDDDFGNPAVILPGSVYVTAGTTRRATGTHYTPRSLTEPIVEHTLEPLVYAGVAEGLPREQWTLRSPADLLDLKVCDMAMGSAGFLVQVVRYLAERLLEAIQKAEGGMQNGADAELNSSFIILHSALSDEDRLNIARRLVAERCIYGVDKNPLAVEIAKLSLWLVTLAKERPFTFLDHALKCGDALVGTSADDFLRWANRKKTAEMSLDMEVLREELERARGLRKQLESFVVNDVRDAERKAALLVQADAAMAHVKRGADLLAGVKLLGLNAHEAEDLQLLMVDAFLAGQLDGVIDPDKHPSIADALAAAKRERVFHWEFEFPEVFEHGGFSAFVGNPPFLGGKRISTTFGENYWNYIHQYIANNAKGSADFCAFFFIRAEYLLLKNGTFGLIATNTIAQGGTREVSLERVTAKNTIFRAIQSCKWPGTANLEVSIIWIFKGAWHGKSYLDEIETSSITSYLSPGTDAGSENIFKLRSNKKKCFVGTFVMGDGFIINQDEYKNLVKNTKNQEVLSPYLNGEDLNSRPDQTPSRWVINFQTWELEKAQRYPECLKILEERVKPYRDSVVAKGKQIHEYDYWKFWDKRLDGYALLNGLNRVLVAAQTSKYLSISFQPTGIIYSHATIVFAFEQGRYFSVLCSTLHDLWVRKYASTLETRLRYIPTDCFETFPLPKRFDGLDAVGDKYHEHRRKIMKAREEGLTMTYNHFHNPEEDAEDIIRLRDLHVEMDNAVMSAYGWDDLSLGHDFYKTAQGVRFTVSEFARREVLSRLLKLNHERYEEEQSVPNKVEGQGKKAKKVKKSESTSNRQIGLF